MDPRFNEVICVSRSPRRRESLRVILKHSIVTDQVLEVDTLRDFCALINQDPTSRLILIDQMYNEDLGSCFAGLKQIAPFSKIVLITDSPSVRGSARKCGFDAVLTGKLTAQRLLDEVQSWA